MNREFQYDKVTNMLKIMNQQKALMEGQKEVTDCAYRSESDDVIREYLESITKVFGKGIEETGRDYDGFQGAYKSIMEEDKRSAQLLDESYGRWNMLYTRLKTLNATLKTGISFGSAGYGEEGREFHVEEFLAEMEKAQIVNQEIKEELIQEKYEEYKKAEKWKEVMQKEDLSRIELMALARVGCELDEAQFSGEGGFMEMAEKLGFDKIANVDPELYTRMYESLMTLSWEGIYEKKELSQIECMVMAQKVMEFTGPEEWNKFAEMSIEKGFLGRYYMNPNLQRILDAGRAKFGAVQSEVIFGGLNDGDLEKVTNQMNEWGGNLAILSFLAGKEVDLSALNGECLDDGKKVGTGDIFKFYSDGESMWLEMLSHDVNKYQNTTEENCLSPGFSRFTNEKGPHNVLRIKFSQGNIEALDSFIKDQMKYGLSDLKVANMTGGMYWFRAGLDTGMAFASPQVGLPYAVYSKASDVKDKANNRETLDHLYQLTDLQSLKGHFPRSIHASFSEGAYSKATVWFDSNFQKDMKEIEKRLEEINQSTCEDIGKIDSPAYANASNFLNGENDYLESNNLGVITVKPGAMEALNQNIGTSPGEVGQFLSALDLIYANYKPYVPKQPKRRTPPWSPEN